jgi:hypothetical protein
VIRCGFGGAMGGQCMLHSGSIACLYGQSVAGTWSAGGRLGCPLVPAAREGAERCQHWRHRRRRPACPGGLRTTCQSWPRSVRPSPATTTAEPWTRCERRSTGTSTPRARSTWTTPVPGCRLRPSPARNAGAAARAVLREPAFGESHLRRLDGCLAWCAAGTVSTGSVWQTREKPCRDDLHGERVLGPQHVAALHPSPLLVPTVTQAEHGD